MPVTLLGGGSNVLISDAGVRGLVIRPRGGAIASLGPSRVRADAAVTINGLVRWTIMHGAAGLEAWAGTPGTVGGAMFGNAHFGGRLIGDLIVDVRLAARDGTTSDCPAAAMAFGYDRSRLQDTGEVLLSATFSVEPGDPAALRRTARESLAFRKRTQPLGCSECRMRLSEPAARSRRRSRRDSVVGRRARRPGRTEGECESAGRGSRRRTATSSSTTDTATAGDIRRLIERCRRAVRERFGVELREEIVYLGEFDVDTVD